MPTGVKVQCQHDTFDVWMTPHGFHYGIHHSIYICEGVTRILWGAYKDDGPHTIRRVGQQDLHPHGGFDVPVEMKRQYARYGNPLLPLRDAFNVASNT